MQVLGSVPTLFGIDALGTHEHNEVDTVADSRRTSIITLYETKAYLDAVSGHNDDRLADQLELKLAIVENLRRQGKEVRLVLVLPFGIQPTSVNKLRDRIGDSLIIIAGDRP